MNVRLGIISGAIVVLIAAGCSTEQAEQSSSTTAATATTATSSAAAPAAVAPATPSPQAAESLVSELYREHDADRSPFFQTEARERVDKFFEAPLAELIWQDAVTANGEVGVLGFDPLYDAQDVEPKNLVVHPAEIDGRTARVPVSFESYGEKRQLTYLLVSSGGPWKISDIRYAGGRTLREAYRPAQQPAGM